MGETNLYIGTTLGGRSTVIMVIVWPEMDYMDVI